MHAGALGWESSEEVETAAAELAAGFTSKNDDCFVLLATSCTLVLEHILLICKKLLSPNLG